MNKQRVLGISMIVVALVIVGQSIWFLHQRGQELDCQSAYNSQVAEDRAALNTMIFDLVNPKATEKTQRDAVAAYVERARATDLTAPDCG